MHTDNNSPIFIVAINYLGDGGVRRIRVGAIKIESGVVWCGVVWCGVVWCGVVWCGV
jgi:hypothetical protein